MATELDAIELQADLDALYEWAAHNNMEFNGTKFEAIKYGKNINLKQNYNYYNSDCSEAIGDVDFLRDHGNILSSDGSFQNHINKVVSKCKQKMGLDKPFIPKKHNRMRKTLFCGPMYKV